MKLKFNFHCDRPVPYYAHRCNQLLSHPQVIATGLEDNVYFFEAEGDQAQLSALAEQVGQEWAMSCWLTHSDLHAVETLSGHQHALAHGPVSNPYCSHCRDHQDACSQCGSAAVPAMDDATLSLAIDALLQDGQCTLETGNGLRRFSLPSQAPETVNQLLFCQPQALNEALHISNQGVKLLSSLEKPMLQLLPKPAFAEANRLASKLHLCHLADDRVTLKLGQRLAQQGIEVVAVEPLDHQPRLVLTFIEDKPVALSHRQLPSLLLDGSEPLWDDAAIAGFTSQVNEQRLSVSTGANVQSINDRWAAACALHSAQLQAPKEHTIAVLYLSRNRPSGLLYQDDNGDYQWLVKLAEQSIAPVQILDTIAQCPDSGDKLVARFKERYPEHAQALASLSPQPASGNLSQLYAQAAWLLNLADASDSAEVAAQKFTALALGHDGKNSPRIDFKLQRQDEVLTLQSQKALQACLSYRMADENSAQGVCYGLIDSFADFVANWVEQLDADIGIDQLALAGDEFESPVLLDRVYRRLGNNFNLLLPQQADFDGSNLALGGVFLKRRNRA
ncbi:hypothetical protein SAMN04488540_102202 [Ferrimonas sediminum]|uniref:Carbamoyltransferase Kae1-like domain-containing protein n=1 Tax=Ferrimonas sediminum TaxID=718193 RepID=A0A1G8LXQ7_9GAMM|nr:hypothetical protein [Ferrimonas sediminum]SDI60479.1 hypothetical protein SAMN04488540_102202 [Ferrimonas sediminum]